MVRQVFSSKALFVEVCLLMPLIIFHLPNNPSPVKAFKSVGTKQWLALLIVQEMQTLDGRLVVEGNIRNCEVYNEELIILSEL